MNTTVPKTICEKEKKSEREKKIIYYFINIWNFKKRNRISTYDFPEENSVKPASDNRYNVN